MKLSIITINRNNAEGLQKTIDSVLCQSWQDFEHIIVDGASTDDSVKFLKHYADLNSSKYGILWISEPDAGIYNAMNKGTNMASGEYCLYLNSGDTLVDSDVLHKVFALNPSEDIFWGQACVGSTNNRIGINTDKFTPFQVLRFGPAHQATFFSRSLMNMVGGYDETYRISADMKCIYRCLLKEQISYRYIDLVISEMQPNGVSYSERELCLKENRRLVSDLFTDSFVNDYYDWLKVNEENTALKDTIHTYRTVIEMYNARKNNLLLRILYKISNYIYNIQCKA